MTRSEVDVPLREDDKCFRRDKDAKQTHLSHGMVKGKCRKADGVLGFL
jgi:hypothetical protein